jgi:thioredoxin reductase
VAIHTERILRLVAEGGHLTRVELEGAAPLQLEAMFFHLGAIPACDLAGQLGAHCDEGGHLEVDRSQETSVPGVYAAGDLTTRMQAAIQAAAAGMQAAAMINLELTIELASSGGA